MLNCSIENAKKIKIRSQFFFGEKGFQKANSKMIASGLKGVLGYFCSNPLLHLAYKIPSENVKKWTSMVTMMLGSMKHNRKTDLGCKMYDTFNFPRQRM